MAKLKFTVYWKKNSIDICFNNPWVERNVDEYQIDNETRFLKLLRINGVNKMINLNDVISFKFEEEK